MSQVRSDCTDFASCRPDRVHFSTFNQAANWIAEIVWIYADKFWMGENYQSALQGFIMSTKQPFAEKGSPLQAHDREFLLRVSYLEIYNEEINDLLNPENRKLPVHENLEVSILSSQTRPWRCTCS